jgi:hypothetical protein
LQFQRGYLESCRLWLAAYAKILKRNSVTQNAREQVLLLWHVANDLLSSMPGGTRIDKLKANFPAALASRGLHCAQIGAVMQRWPNEKHFSGVRAAKKMTEIEAIRRKLDFLQAVRELKRTGRKITETNWRPLLHKDIMTHINDTREKLPPCVIDFRQPQTGLKRYRSRKRHPVKGATQKQIVAVVCEIREAVPGAEELPSGKLTPKN